MKRKEKEPKMALWLKNTPGTLIIRKPRHMRLKHKQRFRATPEELGDHLDKFELLDGDVDFAKFPQFKEGEEVKKPEKEEYTVEHISGGWYNVISPTGEVQNEKKLRSEDAEKLKAELEAESA